MDITSEPSTAKNGAGNDGSKDSSADASEDDSNALPAASIDTASDSAMDADTPAAEKSVTGDALPPAASAENGSLKAPSRRRASRADADRPDFYDDTPKKKRPVWYWLVSVMALFWNLFGVCVFLITLFVLNSEVVRDTLTDETSAVYDNMPPWAIAAFAVAVFAGVLGAVALLAKARAALRLFWLSLGGVILSSYNAFFRQPSYVSYSKLEMLLAFAIIAIAIYLIWFALMAKRRRYID